MPGLWLASHSFPEVTNKVTGPREHGMQRVIPRRGAPAAGLTAFSLGC
jgi:hypothetical protein